MKKNFLLIAMAVCTFVMISCKKESIEQLQATNAPTAQNKATVQNVQNGPGVVTGRTGITVCDPVTVTLIAGQTINSGTVTVTNDADFIYVTYATTNGWVLTQTHLYVGDCALIPVNNPGNPIPGQFPYAGSHSNITSYTYQVPISQIPLGGCGCIAAHAVVKQLDANNQVIQTQTAWGQGTLINLSGGNWGMKFEYCSCSL